jgi:proliferating cell nuclear antigen
MFEAKLSEGMILKKIVDSIKDIVTDVNIDISPSGKYILFLLLRFSKITNIGLSLQAMDSSHVALVSLNLGMDGFETYRADSNMVLGVSITNLAKVMKLADNTDSITLKADQEATHLKIIFENPKTERTTEFNLNLITIDSEHLAIPETEYQSIVTINSNEFSKICKELFSLSETVQVATNADYVQFSVEGEVGSGSVKLGHNDSDKKEDQTTLEVSEPVQQQFALRYLNMFNKAATISSFTRLCLH